MRKGLVVLLWSVAVLLGLGLLGGSDQPGKGDVRSMEGPEDPPTPRP